MRSTCRGQETTSGISGNIAQGGPRQQQGGWLVGRVDRWVPRWVVGVWEPRWVGHSYGIGQSGGTLRALHSELRHVHGATRLHFTHWCAACLHTPARRRASHLLLLDRNLAVDLLAPGHQLLQCLLALCQSRGQHLFSGRRPVAKGHIQNKGLQQWRWQRHL